MRMRKKKHGAERIAALSHLCLDPSLQKPGSLAEIFGNTNPTELEIGCGKGAFILEKARQNPAVNYVAMERVADVMLTGLERCAEENLTNIRFLNADARDLTSYFAPGEIARIYLNFSDPWPKKGYAKRRLTYRTFLADYQKILAKDGVIEMKTDNVILFDSSLEEFALTGYVCDQLTRDLHRSEWNDGNIMTEYERNFSSQGMPIHRVVAHRPEKPISLQKTEKKAAAEPLSE